ncbi:RING-H2 finger protein ATL70-like [Fagus crenata]
MSSVPPPQPFLPSPPPLPPSHYYGYQVQFYPAQTLPNVMLELIFCSLVLLAIIILICYNKGNETRDESQQQHDIEFGFVPENIPLHVDAHVHPDHQTRPQIALLEILSNVVEYKGRGEGIENRIECAICLEDFEDGDVCRELFTCKHTFHKQCVDEWLIIDMHCPLCRGSATCAPLTNLNQQV